MSSTLIRLLSFILFTCSLPAFADTLTVEGAWTRATPPGAKNSATYALIHNSGSEDRALVSANTDGANSVELHTVIAEDGLMKMRQVQAIKIPAGGSVELKPGSFHIMMLGIKQPLLENEHIQVELVFDDGETLKFLSPIKKMSGHAKMDHGKMKHD